MNTFTRFKPVPPRHLSSVTTNMETKLHVNNEANVSVLFVSHIITFDGFPSMWQIFNKVTFLSMFLKQKTKKTKTIKRWNKRQNNTTQKVVRLAKGKGARKKNEDIEMIW